MSKQKNQSLDRIRPYPATFHTFAPYDKTQEDVPLDIFPTGPTITAKLAAYEQQTGLDPALIMRALILGSNVQLLRECAAAVGLKVVEPGEGPELELVVPGSSEHLNDADTYLAGGATEAVAA